MLIMARLLLVHPPHLIADPYIGNKLDTWYGIGLASLHAVAEAAGHAVRPLIANGMTRAQFIDDLTRTIEEFSPTVVGFQMLTSMRGNVFKAIHHLRTTLPALRIILGGPHATAMANQIVEKFPEVVVVLGESESQLSLLLAALDAHAPLDPIPGIVFFSSGRIVRNPTPPPINDLDALPLPRHAAWAGTDAECAGVMTSRGCPFSCSFCSVARRPMRLRSIGSVVDEIESMLVEMPHLRHLRIWDDQFFFKPQRVVALCNEIVKRNIRVGFTCLGRIRPCTREMVLAMEEAGFREILLGLETGSERIAELCDKKIKPADALETLRLFVDSPINVYFFLIVGLEGETWETVTESARFAQQLQAVKYAPYGSTTSVATVYPDNALYGQCRAAGLITEQYWMDEEQDYFFTLEHPLDTLMEMRELLLDHVEPARILLSPRALDKQKGLIGNFLAYVVRNALAEEGPHCTRQYLAPFIELLRNAMAELDASGELRIQLPREALSAQKSMLGLFPVIERRPGSENLFQPATHAMRGKDVLLDFLDYAYRNSLTGITRRVDAAFIDQVARLHQGLSKVAPLPSN